MSQPISQLTLAFRSLLKHTLVPKRYQADPKLGTWVETQRMVHKKLERVPDSGGVLGETIVPNKRLNPERLERLESIGFVWSARSAKKAEAAQSDSSSSPPARAKKSPNPAEAASRAAERQRQNDVNWNDMYNRLAEYKAKHGVSLQINAFVFLEEVLRYAKRQT